MAKTQSGKKIVHVREHKRAKAGGERKSIPEDPSKVNTGVSSLINSNSTATLTSTLSLVAVT